MTAYFAIHHRREETIVCALILLISAFYSAVTYENVYDLASIEEVIINQKELLDEEVFNKWKDDYNHPLCIGSQRKREGSQIQRVNRDINNANEFRLLRQD